MDWYQYILLVLLLIAGFLLVIRNAMSLFRRSLQQRPLILPRRRWLGRLTGLDKLERALQQWVQEQRQRVQEEAMERLRTETIFRYIEEGILILDEEHRVVLANPAMTVWLGGATVSPGVRIERIFSHGEFLDLLRTTRRQGEALGDIEVQGGEGRRVLQVTGRRFAADNQGVVSWLLIACRDITRQRQLEQVRRDFVTNVSHELRTPLTIIKGYVETIQYNGESLSSEERERFLQKIASNVGRLHDLLEHLLELSRLERSIVQLKHRPVVFNDWLAGVAEDFMVHAKEDSQRLQLVLDPAITQVAVDSTRLSRVIENLLENALQSSVCKEQPVQLTTQQEGEMVCVSVCDKGKGIPAEHQAHVFERFYRVDKGRARSQGGFGLGLSIARHTVQLHGGNIWVESKPGEGTCIRFRIPIHTENKTGEND